MTDAVSKTGNPSIDAEVKRLLTERSKVRFLCPLDSYQGRQFNRELIAKIDRQIAALRGRG